MKTAVIINSEGMGHGDKELAKKLTRAFLAQLRRHDQVDALILYNEGVRLAAEGSDLAGDFQSLHEGGIEVLCCGTCVAHLGLEGKIRAGRVSNMEEIVKTLIQVDKTVTI